MDESERDQRLAQIRDILPRMWYAMYQGCLDAGFTETQALELVKAYIAGGSK